MMMPIGPTIKSAAAAEIQSVKERSADKAYLLAQGKNILLCQRPTKNGDAALGNGQIVQNGAEQRCFAAAILTKDDRVFFSKELPR